MLFADDTMTYLSEEDRFEDLAEILEHWCKASGAKFNHNKTVVLPMGSAAYRERVLETRKFNPDLTALPEDIHIAPDGEPTWILGAFVGNNVDQATPWTPILEKIDKTLSTWDKTHPTIHGRCLLIQIVVSGMTQYLTRVQGMPKSVVDHLKLTICTFTWDNERKSPVKADTMSAPIEEGGVQLMDLELQNKAILVMRLKSYLSLNDD